MHEEVVVDYLNNYPGIRLVRQRETKICHSHDSW